MSGVIAALHLVVPQLAAERLTISAIGLQSNFERAFIHNHIGNNHAFLGQLFARQRPRVTLGAVAGNAGSVDFCMEIPYLKWRIRRVFGKNVDIRYHEQLVAEVDGARYHTAELDNLKDFAIAGEGTNVAHIREHAATTDAGAFIGRVVLLPFVRQIQAIYSGECRPSAAMYLHALMPTAIARMQIALLEWLHTLPEEKASLSIAVIEQDIPAARWALDELMTLLQTLNAVAEQPVTIPKINLSVFTDRQKIPQPDAKNIAEFIDDNYDAVFDISMLQRLHIFDSPVRARNLILIRSAHYEEPGLNDAIKVSMPVAYKVPGEQQSDGTFTENPEVVANLRFLLNYLFRKTDFRKGQLPILARALSRKSVVGLLPTGGG